MNKSENINELAAALAKAQGKLKHAAKDSVNPHFKSKYADLAEVISTIRPALAEHGLSVVQLPSEGAAGMVCLETGLLHESGQWLSSVMCIPAQKNDAQGFGSALTYLRRYMLAAIAGIAQDDDDGNAASQKQAPSLSSNEITKRIAGCRTEQCLNDIWDALTPNQRTEFKSALIYRKNSITQPVPKEAA